MMIYGKYGWLTIVVDVFGVSYILLRTQLCV